jgi:hypothetical protein
LGIHFLLHRKDLKNKKAIGTPVAFLFFTLIVGGGKRISCEDTNPRNPGERPSSLAAKGASGAFCSDAQSGTSGSIEDAYAKRAPEFSSASMA